MRSFLAAGCAALLLGAAPSALALAPQAAPASAPAVAPILTTPDARDALSYARPEIARVTHVDLDLTVDFAAQTLSGTAALTVLAQPGATEIILDSENLAIASVTDGNGNPLKWRIGEADTEKGAPLTIQLSGGQLDGAERILIHYTAQKGASALQWLPPELTAGKQKPFLFSQGQAIHNRSWVPTQDSPGIRQTWTARLVVPEGLRPVMSAIQLTPEGEPAGEGLRAYRFAMDKPVPPYLIALAVGDLAFRPLGERTGVYAEPSMLDRAAHELADTERMVEAAEQLYGPYRWGRYDVLVLPPAFPYGGMENPVLTFLTPTFITGDRSNVNLVAHELAHSWSGNLVTNATWPDGWLNEGFTSYFENRIMEALYGRERAVLEEDLDWDVLLREIEAAGGMASPATRLRGEDGEDSGQIDYIKGSVFLRTLEHLIGREAWDAYLASYFDRFAFQPQTTAGFLADLRAHLIKGDAALEEKLQLEKWAYGTGIPENAVRQRSAALARVDAQAQAFAAGGPASAVQPAQWTTPEWLRFLNGLPRQQSAARLAELDQTFNLSRSPNAYVRSAWLELAIANRWEPAVPALEEFLNSVGRTLFLRPLYKGLAEQGAWGKKIANRAYAAARPGYHASTTAAIDAILER